MLMKLTPTVITISGTLMDLFLSNVTELLELTEKSSQTFQTTLHWLELLQLLNGSYPHHHNNNRMKSTTYFCVLARFLGKQNN